MTRIFWSSPCKLSSRADAGAPIPPYFPHDSISILNAPWQIDPSLAQCSLQTRPSGCFQISLHHPFWIMRMKVVVSSLCLCSWSHMPTMTIWRMSFAARNAHWGLHYESLSSHLREEAAAVASVDAFAKGNEVSLDCLLRLYAWSVPLLCKSGLVTYSSFLCILLEKVVLDIMIVSDFCIGMYVSWPLSQDL